MTPSSHRVISTLCAAGLLLAAASTSAHRTYNVSGFAGTLDPFYTLSGNDGFGLPTPTYSGGGGPSGANPSSASYYNGELPVSWLTALHAPANFAGDVLPIGTANALGIGASTPANFLVAAGGEKFGTGLDFGYIRVDNPQTGTNGIRITVNADPTLGSALIPFIALYSGWDHTWQGPNGTVKSLAGGSAANRSAAYSIGSDSPLNTDLLFIAADTNAQHASTASLYFETPSASSHYTVFIGGLFDSAGAYTATVETVTAPVPLPAAFGLLGSALLLLRRRTSKTV